MLFLLNLFYWNFFLQEHLSEERIETFLFLFEILARRLKEKTTCHIAWASKSFFKMIKKSCFFFFLSLKSNKSENLFILTESCCCFFLFNQERNVFIFGKQDLEQRRSLAKLFGTSLTDCKKKPFFSILTTHSFSRLALLFPYFPKQPDITS